MRHHGDDSEKFQMQTTLNGIGCFENCSVHCVQPFAIERTALIGWNPWPFWRHFHLLLEKHVSESTLRYTLNANWQKKMLRCILNTAQAWVFNLAATIFQVSYPLEVCPGRAVLDAIFSIITAHCEQGDCWTRYCCCHPECHASPESSVTMVTQWLKALALFSLLPWQWHTIYQDIQG